jgi:outer membrane biosynthesis protein TonB
VNVDTLVRDQQAAEPRFEHPPAEPDQPVARSCTQCGAAMAPGQDWCLECGTAAPGRLGRRPGLRAAATVVGLTVALVAAAVTAGYAAITGDAGRDVAKPPAAASVTPIAQAPPTTPTAPATSAAPAQPLPTVKPPKTTTPAPPVSHPSTPAPSSAPAATTPTTPTTPASTTPATTTPTTPAQPTLQAIDLGADAAALYDPYTRTTASGDPADAYDGDATTSWKVSSAADGQDMQVGLVVDLSKKRSIKQLKLQTKTPGFRVELYAADTAQLPPDILDTRWAHLRNRSDVAKKQTLALASDSHKYRYVLMWFTTPPKAGPTVKINELKILG